MAIERNGSPHAHSNGAAGRNGAATLNEGQVQGLYDRIAALRQEVTGRLSSSLVQNPQLADAITKQIDDLLQRPLAADDGKAAAAGQGAGRSSSASARRPPPTSARPASRRASSPTTRRSPPSGSSPSATCTTSTSTSGSASSASCRSCRSCSGPARSGCRPAGRLRPLPVRPPRGAALHAPRPAVPPTAASSATAAAPVPPGSRPNTDFHSLFTPLHQPGHALLARQADLRRHPRAGLRPELRLDRHRPPRRAGPAEQPEVDLVRPPERPARRGDAAARRGLPHPERRRHQAAVRRGQRLGRGRGGADPALQRAARHLAAAADGASPAARSCAGCRSRTSCRRPGRSSRRCS